MPNADNRLTLAKLARQYGLKTAQGCEAAKRAGVNIRRGAALVAPWQEDKMRPHFEDIRREKYSREARRLRYLIEEQEYLDRIKYGNDESARFGFTNQDWQEQLREVRRKLENEKEGDTG